jgi:ribosomal-protein-alanine N-acetyltransferase
MKTISPLTSDDFQCAFAIEKACHAFPWSEKTFFSNQGERYLNLKIDCGGTMAGFAITQVVADEATLFNIAVSPDHQRQGLARSLLQQLFELLKQRGVATLWLEVRASNVKAINLYHSFGFNEVTVRPNYYPTVNGREDAVIMAFYL